MAKPEPKLPETETYEAEIYQIQPGDNVEGGPNGVSNRQAKQLANRTKWLKAKVDKLLKDTAGLAIANITGLQAALNKKLNSSDFQKATKAEAEAGTDADKVMTPERTRQAIGALAPPGVPAGAIITSACINAPLGYLRCNGAALSRTTYATLFSQIGTRFGAGDGSTTFNVPDLRGEFLRGWDNGRGADNGRALGSFQGDAFRSHYHVLSSTLVSAGSNQTAAGATDTGGWGFTTSVGGTETRPRNVAVAFYIKY